MDARSSDPVDDEGEERNNTERLFETLDRHFYIPGYSADVVDFPSFYCNERSSSKLEKENEEPGIQKTDSLYEILNRHFYIPGYSADVVDFPSASESKQFAIMKCQKLIKFIKNQRTLAQWVDSNISAAWRYDEEIMRAVIESVCERTIKSKSSSGYEIDLKQLRSFFDAFNFLYGAPEAFQLQTLNSVYDHVRNLENSENVLKKVLNIMWYDGYISRQVILSWLDNMDHTSAIKVQEIMAGIQKDLREEIQERIKARLGVRKWLQVTTEMCTLQTAGWFDSPQYQIMSDFAIYDSLYHQRVSEFAWYDSPHYQRVALHALCQLAVTWQGDKCTVDKDLLFHYIPQLYCDTRDGLQLLYTVQCVLYHLHNPPGLTVAVLQALLTIIRPYTEDKPLITTTDWDKWRNTQNPLYDEGRYIIQQQGRFLDLIVLASSKVTLKEINSWICENIPQDQMLDAWIITAAYLLNQEEEVALIRHWITQNAPQKMQTVVQDTLKTMIIERCVHEMESRDCRELTDWVDKHMLPAWRQDAQFVRAAIKAVCERTIHTDKIDSPVLRGYLGAVNCLYGAPEVLQLQALESVYDHVRTLQHPEKVLQEVLDIMWSDGYISKQVIQSWSDIMEQTSVMKFHGKLVGSKKDLGEQVQERMRTRQEVKWWMESITHVASAYSTARYHYFPGIVWYDFPYYQRVVLHALCQLAVTWQGDKCTVDKDLLFNYIPQLYCDIKDGLQLLYAVQCVLHHLQNPPGLAVALLQALLSISRPYTKDKPLITTTDWDKWRNTQNPAYEEGRNIIQQQGHFLDLIVLVRGGVTLTEINGWICANIPQDQMLHAFIITAECLLNREKEVPLIRNWISQNVPLDMQTVVSNTLKTITVQRCLQKILSGETILHAYWVDRHILPAWRRESQFVSAVIKAACEKTIHSDQIDSKQLRFYLGNLNCLYGAREALQLQALDSVYDHVRTLQHPEKVLQEVLDIMWYDGYINRHVILSWWHNMEQTSAIMFKGILADGKKDLGEQIQERMRVRQEVRRWMGDATQLSYSWYDSPHYQRVALHALCQLAVTWHGDKCTVDKDLLFHYIPQLFHNTRDGLQLLYAVQCVLHHLQNPPGLAVAVLQALLTISRPDTGYKPIITTTDWDKWRNTQNPVYDEGRNIIQEQVYQPKYYLK